MAILTPVIANLPLHTFSNPRNTVNPDIFYWLQEYLIKSFVMDDERLKNPPVGSSVLERIRDIRASMRRVYLQVICPLLTLSQRYRH